MKGTVEVYRVSDKKELLCKESNLIVDGAGESIVDIFTLPPSMNVSSLGTTDTEISTVFDVSNYCISLMSLGKSKTGYQKNLHTYKKHNLIVDADSMDNVVFNNTVLTPVFTESPADSSSIVHRISSTDIEGGYIEWDNFDLTLMQYLYSAPKVFSIDIKLDPKDTVDATTDEQGVSRSYVTIQVGTEFFTFGFTNPEIQQLGDVKGVLDYVRLPEQRPVFYKHLGNNWFRVGCVIPEQYNTNGTFTDFSIKLYPCSLEDETGDEASDRIGSVLISRPSFNVGSLPITYYIRDDSLRNTVNEFDEYPALFLSVAQTKNDPYVLDGPGTLTNYANGYNVSGELCKYPDPNDSVLQPDTGTAYADNVDCKLYNGHNLNLYSVIRTDRASLADYIGDGWSYTSKYASLTIPSDFAWFGSFATDNERSDYEIRRGNITDIGSYVAANNSGQTITGTKFNSSNTMDTNGFIRVFNSKTNNYAGDGNNSLCKVVSNESAANNGIVSFKLIINAADRYVANCFGGIFEAGLFTLDVAGSRKLNNKRINKSLNRNTLFGDDLASRLFCKKSFTFDITNNPVFSNQSNVELIWSLDFNES